MSLSIVLRPCPVGAAEPAVPILLYHRLGPVRADWMTVTTEHFKEQMELLRKNNYSVIPLSEVVDWRLGKHGPPPPRSVVVTFDDGHLSVYRDGRAVVISERIPVTLFIYPSCISRASYAMTWEQISEMVDTSYFTVQSHTYWHPNFKEEEKKLDHNAYVAFVDKQLELSKTTLQGHVHQPITLLAWPFGIYNDYVEKAAAGAGYQAAFSIDRRGVTAADPIMKLPRFIVLDEDLGPRFLRLIDSMSHSAKK